MIFKGQVRDFAELYLKTTLRDVPSALAYLLAPERFPLFVDLLHVRLNELDLCGYVKSRGAINQFIMQATSAYGRKQLEKAGMPVPGGDLDAKV